MKTILLATDGSPSAGHALEMAIELCRDTHARLVTLTVRTLRPHGDPDAPHGDHMDQEPVAEEIAEEAAIAARLLGIDAESRTAYGEPAAAIAEVARELDADLVVVGSHGRDRIEALVLGSVSRALLSRCDRPLTIVRGVPAGMAEEAHTS
jgi:nucleotide-binding universal stress UspA family protein